MYKLFTDECAIIDNARCIPWIKYVKRTLDEIGFSHLWQSQNINIKLYPVLKQ